MAGRCFTASGDSSGQAWYVRLLKNYSRSYFKAGNRDTDNGHLRTLFSQTFSLLRGSDLAAGNSQHALHTPIYSLQVEESSNQVTMEGILQPPDIFGDMRKDGREGCCSKKCLWGALNASCFLSLVLIQILIRNKAATQRSLGTGEQGYGRNSSSVLAFFRAYRSYYTLLLGVPDPRENCVQEESHSDRARCCSGWHFPCLAYVAVADCESQPGSSWALCQCPLHHRVLWSWRE